MTVAGVLPEDALEANSAGRLTDVQRRGFRSMSRGIRKTELQFAVVLTILGLLVWFAEGPAKYATVKPLVGIAFLIIAGLLLVRSFVGADALTQDLRAGHVDSVEGAITKRSVSTSTRGSRMTSYYFDVEGRSISVSGVAYTAAPDAGFVKVYFLPRSHQLVNMERLPDPPLAAGALTSQQTLQDLAHALRSSDPIEVAEARAAAAAVGTAIKGQKVKGAVAPPDTARDPRPLAEAILGEWAGAMISASFDADGTVTMTMPGGHQRPGHWCVDVSGHLVSDVTGGGQPADAWVSGDQLTVSIGGTGLKFQRVLK